MAPRPRWYHTLQEARRQACLAVDFYNRPGDKRNFFDFVVHMHLAWQNLLHADLERRGVETYYRNSQGRFARGKDGEKRTWELQQCLRHEFADSHPVRLNVELFIGLRNKIEHRFHDAFMVATAAHAHALVINFEAELVARFGQKHSLGAELRFPVFVQSLTPEGVAEQQKVRRRLPRTARNYIARFEAAVDPAVLADIRYTYRVQLTPIKGPKTDADLAVTFANIEQLTDEQRSQMEVDGQTGTVLLAEKQREVLYADAMLPKQVIAAVDARVPYHFNRAHFIALWQRLRVRPRPGEAKPRTQTDQRYCLYDRPNGNYVYRPAFIERLIEEVGTREKFREVFGKEPQMKVTSLQDRLPRHEGSDPASVSRPAS